MPRPPAAPLDSDRGPRRQRTRTERRRARTRVRLGLALILVVVGLAVVLTDLHGRSELRQQFHSLAVAHRRLADTQLAVATRGIQTQASYDQIQSIETTTADNAVDMNNTDHAITNADIGIYIDGSSLPTLNLCLTGAVQVLDQIDVDQVASAISELVDLTPICDAVTP